MLAFRLVVVFILPFILILSSNFNNTIYHKIAIIFRIKNIKTIQKNYITKYYTQCKNDYDVWFLIDGYGKNKYPKYYINSSCVLSYFPYLLSYSKSCIMLYRKDTYSAIGYSTFTEQIVIWYLNIKRKYNYIWYLEQDLVFLGNIRYFFDSYINYSSNIIFKDKLFKDSSNKWIWKSCHSKNINLSYNEIYHGHIFITRIDEKVIKLLYTIHKNGIHLYCERVLHYLLEKYRLTYTVISPKWKGQILCCCIIKYNSWKNISNNIKYNNKFFHSVKY